MTNGIQVPGGGASAEGTERIANDAGGEEGRFRRAIGLTWSNVGVGTYLGAADDETDALVSDAVLTALRSGINVIDTAANYRRGRGETAVGNALLQCFEQQVMPRDAVILCTKAGYLTTSGEQFLDEYLGVGGIADEDLVGGNHCMHPAYIEDRISKSCANLGVEKIDVFYLHNPEAQLAHISRQEFDSRLSRAFEVLEAAADAGRIGCYGLATWRAFRASPGEPGYISIAGIKTLARQVAGDKPDRLRCLQMPLSISMPEAVNRPTQWVGDATVSAIAAARLLDLAVAASGSIGQGKIPEMNPALKKWLGADMQTDHQRALQFTRSASGLTTALVGMKQESHVRENIDVFNQPPLSRAAFELMFRKSAV